MTTNNSPQGAPVPVQTAQPAAAGQPVNGLVAAAERIMGRAVTKDEAVYWERIQDTYGISDDDPLVLVLVLMAIHNHLFNEVPARIKDATDAALAVHRTTLEDQATIVAKGVIATLTPMIRTDPVKSPQNMWVVVGASLLAATVGALIAKLIH